jgi:hypothetical protein
VEISSERGNVSSACECLSSRVTIPSILKKKKEFSDFKIFREINLKYGVIIFMVSEMFLMDPTDSCHERAQL